MTDAAIRDGMRIAARRAGVASGTAAARVKQRNRAERRFRVCGMLAVSFAILVLVVLLADIAIKALPAFTQSRLMLDLPVSAANVDAKAPASGDFDAVVRDGLRALFPDVTSRGDRKALSEVLSSGAGDPVRRLVTADPSLIGGTVKAPVLLSSDADLYLKGITARTREIVVPATAAPSETAGALSIAVGGNGLATELDLVKKIAAERAVLLEREGNRLTTTARSVSADLKSAEDRLAAARDANDAPDVKTYEILAAKHRESKNALEAQALEMLARAADLRKRSAESNAAEVLDSAMPSLLVMLNGGVVKATAISPGQIDGEAIVPLASKDTAESGGWKVLVVETPENSRKIQDRQIAFLEKLRDKGAVQSVMNLAFFTNGDSREPELAGILGALMGSAFTMLVTLALCLPLGVGAAVYLEEFAPKNRLTGLVEVNINNLAAVPSIVFGLLGLAMFLNFFGMTRSSPLVGGLVLALLVLPTIIIASRAALKAVPPSIREAALGVGASQQQAIFHHVLPVAMPGILTGAIIGMAHALGETAPLLMIGMIAFIVDVPSRVTDAATVLPVQIYLWSDLPETGFQTKTAAAIIVLLMFLFAMNGLAIWLRKKFERRW